ncbi:hypothetical protein [Pacificibacter maritimus]|nr:hypothetical protein [Pacificibacter maritimus]
MRQSTATGDGSGMKHDRPAAQYQRMVIGYHGTPTGVILNNNAELAKVSA